MSGTKMNLANGMVTIQYNLVNGIHDKYSKLIYINTYLRILVLITKITVIAYDLNLIVTLLFNKYVIISYCFKILDLIKDNNVVLIQGETGSGKSTQIPQFLLEVLPSLYFVLCNFVIIYFKLKNF